MLTFNLVRAFEARSGADTFECVRLEPSSEVDEFIKHRFQLIHLPKDEGPIRGANVMWHMHHLEVGIKVAAFVALIDAVQEVLINPHRNFRGVSWHISHPFNNCGRPHS